MTYFGSELLQKKPHNVNRKIDDRVPLRPAWVYVYVCWFPLILFVPVGVYYCSRELYVLYIYTILADIVLSTIAYIVYPTSFEREKPKKGFFGQSLSLIYFFSFKGYNCAPSMHCSMCYIIIVTMCICPGVSLAIKAALVILALLIVAATQFTKQHTIIDALTAIPAAALAFLIAECIIKVHPAAVLLANLGL